MPANNEPIFTRQADIQWIGPIVTANTTADLSSGTSYLVWTADATNGGWLESIRFRSTPAGSTTATVARIFVNNGSTTGTAANNSLFDEITLPATTASGTAATAGAEVPVRKAFPPGYKVYITIHTASANGWYATAFGGKY
jgi:hypothetical protein